METHIPREDSVRVVALAAVVWGAVVAAAALEGTFALFDDETLSIFAALVSLYGVAACRFDPQLRALAQAATALRTVLIASAFAFGLAAALATGFAAAAIFLAPFAAISGIAAAASLRRRIRVARSTSPAKSPGANPAAT
jgi:hypothetical protein